MKTLFNNGWQFAKAPVGTDAFDGSLCFKPTDIPHDWLIADAENLYESSFGIYKKTFTTGHERVRLYFEGVYQDCTVYANGKIAGENKYGYSSFEVDVSPYLKKGENEITVLVRHESPNSRWYSGAGIFRNVWLYETGESYLVTDSVYFSAKRNEQKNAWECSLSAEFVGEGEVFYSLTAPDGAVLSEGVLGGFEIANNPDIVWDIEHPALLTLRVYLVRNGETVDEIMQNVGLREIEFRPDSGFFLNGRNVKLHGVCLHHDQGALGAAFNKEAERRRLLSMKEMGVNSVRTSHNMPAVGFMELCDELGILVDSEAFDMWERPKTEFDYARFFDEWYKKDVKSWVCRDRNHPSVIMWSVGNEIYDTHLSERGREVTRMLHEAVKEHDPLCNAFTTFGSNYIPWENAQRCAEEIDVVGYNYAEKCYRPHHEAHPDWKIYGSETTSGVKSRGIYHFPRDCAFLTHEDLQCSSLGNCRAGASAATAEQTIALDLEHEMCAGMYIWTGSDYIGEPTPYFTKNSYYGSIDTAGLKKDIFWLYKAAWGSEPVLHLFPSWDFNEGQQVDIVAYTNLESVELFINGKSLGVKTPEMNIAAWQAPYEKGTITARGKKGEIVLTDSRSSFGDSAAIVLRTDKPFLKADGCDLAAVEITTVDADGNPVDNARDSITITVEGARLVGFDNGDSTDYMSYKSAERRLFSGAAVALIAAGDKQGTAVIRAESPMLKSAEITLPVVEAEVAKGTAFSENIRPEKPSGYVPVRKIALTRTCGSVITPETNGAVITAEILPANATDKEQSWSVVTAGGIISNAASVEADGNSAVLNVVSDGEFRLRCTAKNGKKHADVISEFEFTSEGFGQAVTNPYKFVTACFYDKSIGEMDEVSEGGISLTNDKNSICFTRVDFGKYGSDRFKLRCIYWFTNEPVDFSVYAGDGKLLGKFTYQADFIWQTYQDNEFKLSERLFGEQDIRFSFEHHENMLHMGGFEFVPMKAYSKITAADSDLLHGDTYEINGGCIEHIGNNVFIEYAGMNFTRGVSAITLYGRSHHDNDSIHLSIESDGGQTVSAIIEFAGSAEYTSVTLPLDDIRGNATVKFGFLPGCDFDMQGFEITPADN